MVADDLATAGFEPTNISNIIDVDRLDREVINSLMQGLTAACDFAGISISGGEIAELGNRIGGYGDGMHFNWCSTAIGVLPDALDEPFDGTAVQAGHKVVALRARGFRSNGFSLVRRLMQAAFGEEWHNEPYEGNETWGQALLTPSLIYTPIVNAIIREGIPLSGIAHITGGGIADNFQRVLKANGLGAKLDQLFEPLPLMQRLMDLGQVALEDAYLYWNMGNGMLMTVEEKQLEMLLALGEKHGYAMQVAGEITTEKGISLHLPEKTLSYFQ